MGKVVSFFIKNKLIPICILMVIFISVLDRSFLNDFNLNSLLIDISIIGIMTMGQMLVILTGGIDLSIGNIASAASVFLASMMIYLQGLPPEINLIVSVLYALAFGTLLGLINGIAVGVLRIPPILATLGGLWIAQGMAFIFLRAQPTPLVVKSFTNLARFKIGFVPVSFLLLLLIVSIIYYVLNNRREGLSVYAVGGNEYSAHLSGINVKKTKILVYALSGLLATIGGLVLVAFTGTSFVRGATGYEMFTIAAVVVGGFAISGGAGKVENALLGVFFIRLINKLMIFLNLSNQAENIYVGIILLIALYFSTRTKVKKPKLIVPGNEQSNDK